MTGLLFNLETEKLLLRYLSRCNDSQSPPRGVMNCKEDGATYNRC